MKKMFFGIMFFLAVYICAQDREIFNYPLGAENMAAFENMSDHLSKQPIVKGTFEQEKVLSRLNRSLKSSGNFIIAADTGMVWETLKPFPSTLVLGRDYLVQFRGGGQKTVLSAQGNETFLSMSEVLSAVFSGQSQTLINNFEIFYKDGGENWELGLIPLDTAIAVFASTIIMKGGSAINSIIIYEQSGDSITYNLSNHSFPKELNIDEKVLFAAH